VRKANVVRNVHLPMCCTELFCSLVSVFWVVLPSHCMDTAAPSKDFAIVLV
jgi:hypothetical protein